MYVRWGEGFPGVVCLDCTASDRACAVVVPTPRALSTANNNNPKFVKQIRVKYAFEQQQLLVFRLYDVDTVLSSQTQVLDVEKEEFIGEIQCFLSQVMGARASTFEGNVVCKSW